MSFLQAVMQKIRRQPQVEQTHTASVVNLAKQINRYRHLLALQEKRQLLEVVCSATGRTYQSMILAVNMQEQTIELDELFPQPYGEPHRVGDQFQVKHHHNGQILSFTGTVESIVQNRSGFIYTLTLPDTVQYRQRRRYPRIELSKESPLTIKLESPRNATWFATATNLSAGGMRLTIGGNIVDQLERNGHISLCEFELLHDIKIRCEAKVKAFRFCRRPYRHTEVSIEFMNCPVATKQQLESVISSFCNNVEAA